MSSVPACGSSPAGSRGCSFLGSAGGMYGASPPTGDSSAGRSASHANNVASAASSAKRWYKRICYDSSIDPAEWTVRGICLLGTPWHANAGTSINPPVEHACDLASVAFRQPTKSATALLLMAAVARIWAWVSPGAHVCQRPPVLGVVLHSAGRVFGDSAGECAALWSRGLEPPHALAPD
jgi:hypothetical protein